MNTYDLIAFDMDGTLLNSNKEILPDSLNAIKLAARAGKTVALSTGRCLPELQNFRRILSDVRYFICVSGALVVENPSWKVIHESSIAPEIVEELFERTKFEDVMIHILSMDSVVQSSCAQDMNRYNMGIYQTMFDDITYQPDDIRKYYDSTHVPVYKMNFYSQNETQRQRIKATLSDMPLTFSYSEISSYECSPFGTTKGSGLKMLCKHLGIPIERTIAVGDADNDLDILKTAGLAIAMGNSNRRVLEISDVIVSDNDSNGCAEAIYKYLLQH